LIEANLSEEAEMYQQALKSTETPNIDVVDAEFYAKEKMAYLYINNKDYT